MSATATPIRPGVYAPPTADAPVPMAGREIAAMLGKYRWRLVAAMLVPMLIAVALLVVLPKRYRAEADIVVKTGREYMAEANGQSANLTGPSSTKQENINSEIALLTSRAVAETTLAKIGVETLYPDLVTDPPTSGTVMDAAVLRFAHDLSVDPVKLSDVVGVSFDAASPAQARLVLNTLIGNYIATHTQVFTTRRANGYRGAIDTAMGEVRSLEQRRSALKLSAGIYDSETQRAATIRQWIDAETRLEDASSRQAQLTARLAYLNEARARTPATVQAASTEQSDAQTHASEASIDLHQQEAALRDRVGDANPDLQRLRAEIAAVDRAGKGTGKVRNATTAPSPLRLQLEQEIVTTGAALAATGSEIGRLREFVAGRNAALAQLERADVQLRDLALQLDAITQNLRAMQGRFEQARTDEQSDMARQVSVVQVADATGSSRPVSPKKIVFGAAGVLGGLLLAGLVGMLTLLTSKVAVTEEAVERRVGLPVLAVVPFDRHEGRDGGLAYGSR